MILPSKELLSEVLNCPKPSILHQDTDNHLYYSGVHTTIPWNGEINIYELMHMMKEWAVKQGYELESGLSYCNYYKGPCDYKENLIDYTIADTEPEAVTKACEWILKEIQK